jgi:L-threonylcarbamoyladenylate synthase
MMSKIDTSSDAFSDALRESIGVAARRLDRGRLVAFPTETVYGLGADASDANAVARIFAAKGRPSNHPLIVHVPVDADLHQWASDIPPLARHLIERFWPGPLTLIVSRRDGVGEVAAGGQDSIGMRCPSHPVAQALLKRYATLRAGRGPIGIAAPSANRFGHVSPTRASHVLDEFVAASTTDANANIFVVDGGDCPFGIESTIVDCSRLDRVGPVLLRPGSVTEAMLAEVIGAMPGAADREAPRASGTLESHYAPTTPLRLVDASTLPDAPDDVATWGFALHASTSMRRRVAPRDAAVYAHELYATLRLLDATHSREIWVERPPITAAWDGVNDRLARAAATPRDEST